jgi:hypothetical protein
MLVILAMVPQAYEPRLVPGHAVEAEVLITLLPNYGVLVALHQRRRTSR